MEVDFEDQTVAEGLERSFSAVTEFYDLNRPGCTDLTNCKVEERADV